MTSLTQESVEILKQGKAYLRSHKDDKADACPEEIKTLLRVGARVRHLNASHCDKRYPYRTIVLFRGVLFATVTQQPLSI